jgi:hypothetical protein
MRNITNKLPFICTIIFSIYIILDRYNISQLINYDYFSWHNSYGQSINQHLGGWYGFLNDKWRFPLTVTNSINYPESSSIILTDSLPFFAIIFKLLKPLIPDTFHYFGIWKILCILFLGISSYKLSDKFITKNQIISFLFSVFCICSFPLFIREGNPTLNGHFLLILGLFCYCNLINEFNLRNILLSLSILILSLHIHFYFFCLVFAFILSGILQNYIDKKINLKKVLTIIFFLFLIIILFGIITGFFYSFGGINFDRFDNKGMPLLSLFFGSNELNFKTLFSNNRNVIFISEQYESLNYLGISLIVLLTLSLFLIKDVKILKKHLVLITFFILIFIYSLGGKIYITENIFFTYNHHKIPFMSSITGLLAVAGRLFIFNYTILIFFCFKQIVNSNINKSYIALILSTFTIVQFYEIYHLNFSQNKLKSNIHTILNHKLFSNNNSIQEYYLNDHLLREIDLKDTIIIPPYVCEGSTVSQKISGYILYNKKKVNSIWQGRDNFNCEDKKKQAISLLNDNNSKDLNIIYLNKVHKEYIELNSLKKNLNCNKKKEITLCKR